MADATFVQDGASISYTPVAAVAAGKIVELGSFLGVTKVPIAAGQLGAVALEGVFQLTKDGTSGPIFAIGDPVYWDPVALLAVDTGGIFFGLATEAAGTNQAFVRAKLRPPADIDASTQSRLWEDVDLTSGSKTLDAEDIGKVMNVTVGSATNVITLPSTAVGLAFTIRNGTTGQRVAVSPAAADRFIGANLTGLANKDRINTAATAVAGDLLSIVHGGTVTWSIIAEDGIWVQEA